MCVCWRRRGEGRGGIGGEEGEGRGEEGEGRGEEALASYADTHDKTSSLVIEVFFSHGEAYAVRRVPL